MKNSSISFLITLMFFTGSLYAQEESPCSITLSQVTLSTGWYQPSMDYWNNTFLPDANSTDRFGGNFLYSGNITVDFPLNLGTRVGVWYWEDAVSGEEGGSFNTLHVDFTGLTIGAFYKYRPGFWGIRPYLGLDESFLFIQDRYNVSGVLSKKSGMDFVFTPFLGIDRVIGSHFLLGIEYGYRIGHYMQDVETISGISAEKVSINGHLVQLTIGYAFP